MSKRTCILVSLLSFGVGEFHWVAAQGASPPRRHVYSLSSRGAPFSLNRTALHFVNESGRPFTLHIEREPIEGTGPRSYARYWTVRILDPKEDTVFQREYADANTASFKQEHLVPSRGPGVYQVLINAGIGGAAKIWTKPDLPMAVDSRCYPWYLDQSVREAYFYVPQHTTRVLVDLMPLKDARDRTMVLYDDDGKELARVAGSRPHNIVTLEPERTDVVWRVATEGSGPFKFHLDHVRRCWRSMPRRRERSAEA